MTSARSSMHHFVRSSGVMAMLYLASTGLTFLVGIVLARMLGASGYGVYALAMTTATLAGMVTEFGLPVLAMREVGAARAHGEWGELRGLLHWADRAIIGLSLILFIGTWGGYFLLFRDSSSDYLAALLWAVLLIPVVALGKLRSFVLLALDRVFSSQFPVMVLRPALFIAGCLGVYWFEGSLRPDTAMAVQTGGATIAMLIIVTLFRRHRPAALASAPRVMAVHSWLSACLPMGMTEGLRLLQGQLGLILIGLLSTTAQAGIYRVADAVTQITALFGSVVATAATPMFGRLWNAGDHAAIQRIAVLAAWVMVGGSLLLGLPLALLGHWIFPLVFGAEFAASVPVFALLWAGVVLASTFGLVFALANMAGQHVLATQSLGVIALANLVFGGLLIPDSGAIGAATASIVAWLCGLLFCTIRFKRRTGMNASVYSPATATLLRDAYHYLRPRFPGSQTGLE